MFVVAFVAGNCAPMGNLVRNAFAIASLEVQDGLSSKTGPKIGVDNSCSMRLTDSLLNITFS
jgi:hypothetical protein